MIYPVFSTFELRIQNVNSGAAGEVTINLGSYKPSLSIKKASYISGVFDSSGNKNPRMPYCEVNSNSPTITSKSMTISASSNNEITVSAKTKLMQL